MIWILVNPWVEQACYTNKKGKKINLNKNYERLPRALFTSGRSVLLKVTFGCGRALGLDACRHSDHDFSLLIE